MSAPVFPLWFFGLVAFGIAAVAFLLGQAFPGAGVLVAAAGSTGWTAYVATRANRLTKNG